MAMMKIMDMLAKYTCEIRIIILIFLLIQNISFLWGTGPILITKKNFRFFCYLCSQSKQGQTLMDDKLVVGVGMMVAVEI